MYKVFFCRDNETLFETFAQAFRYLYEVVKKEKNNSLQLLETATWIEDVERRTPIMFFKAIERAREEGLLSDDGKLID